MRVSRKTDYALRALFTLVDHCKNLPVSKLEFSTGFIGGEGI